MTRFAKEHGLFLAVLLLVLLVAFPVLTYPMGRDQGMYANIGLSILNGGTPFVDMWDIKPPPIYYIYAAGIAIFGRGTEAIRAIDFALVPLGMLGLYLFGRRMQGKRLGLLAALLYGLFYFNEDFPSLSQNDSLVTVPMIWAAYSALRASNAESGTRQAVIWSLLTGFWCGLVLWFKHYFAFFVLALVVNQLWSRLAQKESRGGLWKEALAFAAGGLLTGDSLLVYFWAQGMIAEMLIVAQGTAAYNAQGYDFAAFLGNMANYWGFRWQTWHGLLLLAGLWIPVWIFLPPANSPRFARGGQVSSTKPTAQEENGFAPMQWGDGRGDEIAPTNPIPSLNRFPLRSGGTEGGKDVLRSGGTKGGMRLVWLWLMAALTFALIQAKGFDTHWIPMLPPLALLAGGSLAIISRTFAQKQIVRVTLGFVLIALVVSVMNTTWGRSWHYLTGAEDRVAYFSRFQANDLKPEESLLMANYLRERVAPGDTLFIWGFRPEVTYMAGLRPATRYQAHFPLVAPWYPQEWRQENVDILWAAMPPYALILEDDYMPWVTDYDADSHSLLQDYMHLNNWYAANYQRTDQIGDFIIWSRQATP